MQYKKLGRSGLKVSRLCLGTMMFGGRATRDDSIRIVEAARDDGVNFLDTADGYNAGESERIVGEAVRTDRDDWIVASKVAVPMGEEPNRRGLSRGWIMAECDNSLARLGTGHIDLYYLHKEDHETDLAETVRAMGDLMRAGKIRYWGVSNYRAWRIAEICRLADMLGVERPIACQPYYNALNRMPEVEVLPACAHYGLAVVPYSPLARGVLTGKYAPGAAPPPDSRAARNDKRIMETEWREESLDIAQKVTAHADAMGITVGQYAIAWLLANDIVTSVIAGPRTLDQWIDYVPAVDYAWSGDDEALLDALVKPGHPSTPGYSDPSYPIEGRRVNV